MAASRLLIQSGGVLLAVSCALPLVQTRLGLPDGVIAAAVGLSLAVLTAGLVGATFRFLPPLGGGYYILRPARLAEIDSIYSIVKRMLGDDIATARQVKAYLKRDPRSVQVIVRRKGDVSDTRSRIVGFFSLFELGPELTKRLMHDEIKGSSITPRQILGPSERGCSLYIGATGAEGWRARGELVRLVNGYLSSRVRDDLTILITRPITNANNERPADRLMKKYQFKPVPFGNPNAPLNYFREYR